MRLTDLGRCRKGGSQPSDKINLDIFWVKDHALDDPDLLPPPDEVAAEIVESLETALDRFRNVAKALGEGPI